MEDKFLKHQNLADATMDYLNRTIQENSKIASEENKNFAEQLAQLKEPMNQMEAQGIVRTGPKVDLAVEERLTQKLQEF